MPGKYSTKAPAGSSSPVPSPESAGSSATPADLAAASAAYDAKLQSLISEQTKTISLLQERINQVEKRLESQQESNRAQHHDDLQDRVTMLEANHNVFKRKTEAELGRHAMSIAGLEIRLNGAPFKKLGEAIRTLKKHEPSLRRLEKMMSALGFEAKDTGGRSGQDYKTTVEDVPDEEDDVPMNLD